MNYRDQQLIDFEEKGVRQNVISDTTCPWGGSVFDAAEHVKDLESELPRSDSYYEGKRREREEGNKKVMADICSNNKTLSQVEWLSKEQI